MGIRVGVNQVQINPDGALSLKKKSLWHTDFNLQSKWGVGEKEVILSTHSSLYQTGVPLAISNRITG